MPTALDVRQVTKRFEDRLVLDQVSFSAKPGDIVAVIGPSGCGKTTLMRCILGELAPDDGSILLDGKDVTRVPPERRGVGIVYQSYALFPHMSVRDNVGYGLRVRRVKRDKIDARVKEMLALARMEEKADALPHRLSGGERQRVALARALAVEPRMLLLDEAFAALDATTRADVVHEVRGIIRKMGLTTLLVTHDQEESFLFARHVLVLNEGRVVTMDAPENVIKHAHPFIRDFMKMVVFHEAKVEEYASGQQFVTTEGGAQIGINIPGVNAGDVVHVIVKKGPTSQSVEVWPIDEE